MDVPGFNSVSDVTVEHPNTSDAGVESDADGALGVVGRRGNLAGAPSAVPVAVDQVVSEKVKSGILS